jgi:hypothetical protein
MSANMARRDLTQNQKAVVLAKSNNLLQWGSKAELSRVAGIHPQRISEALTVLRYAPGLADDVLAKKLRLDEAVIEARRLRAIAETNEEQWQRVRAGAPDFADAGISLAEALQKLEIRNQEDARLKVLDRGAPSERG